MAPTLTAVYDANVLYPAPLRDLLMHLARTELFQARWTRAIHEEWTRSLLADRPELTLARLQRTRDQMNAAVRGCLVEDYEALIPSLSLPDADDRHVLAAAIHSRTDVIVTYNLKDFPPRTLAAYGIQAQHPDEFISRLLDLNISQVCAAIQQQRAALHRPPYTAEQLLDTLERQGLPQTVARLRPLADQI